MPSADAPILNADSRLLVELLAPSASAEGIHLLAKLDQAESSGHTGLEISERHASTLEASGLARRTTAGEDPGTPLILDGDWLAHRRAWDHEQRLARDLTRRALANRRADLDADPGFPAALTAAFPESPRALSAGGIDWQRLAAATALERCLTVITGGPGCGKTAVAGRIAALLVGHHRRLGRPAPVIVLAAPTGKAAGRLVESVRAEVAKQDLSAAEQIAITAWSSTLHRLFHDVRCTQVDLAIIDETSMASAATLARVLARIPANARVILLGDPDQLASVEPGRVLGDLAHPPAGHAITATQVRLRVNWRSGEAPALAALVRALQEDDPTAAALLETPADIVVPTTGSWVHRRDLPHQPGLLIQRLVADHHDWLAAFADLLAHRPGADGAAAALLLSTQVRLLTVLRRGPWGVEALNELWERHLLTTWGLRRDAKGHYPGRLLLVTGNRPDLDLANGDVGIVWNSASAGTTGIPSESQHVAYFSAVAGVRAIPLHRLDGVVPAWFLTVHKAQGSQGNLVEVVGLPTTASLGQRHLATREMAYTAITRAASRLRVWWDAPGLTQALSTREGDRRTSGFPIHLAREQRLATEL